MGFSLNGMSNPGRWKNCLYTYMTRSTVWNIESRDASRAISCTGGQRIRKHRISHHTPGSVKKRSRISNRRQQQFPLLLLLHNSTAHQTHHTTQHSTAQTTRRKQVCTKDLLLHHFYIYARGRPPRLNGLVSCACDAVTATTVTGNDSNYRQHKHYKGIYTPRERNMSLVSLST